MKNFSDDEFKELSAKEKSLVLSTQYRKIDKKQIAYSKKIEYQKKRSKYIRHLYPEKAQQQNIKYREIQQKKRWKEFFEKKNHLKLCIFKGLEIPEYLQNLKEPKIYKEKQYVQRECPEDCTMCEEARIFLKVKNKN